MKTLSISSNLFSSLNHFAYPRVSQFYSTLKIWDTLMCAYSKDVFEEDFHPLINISLSRKILGYTEISRMTRFAARFSAKSGHTGI